MRISNSSFANYGESGEAARLLNKTLKNKKVPVQSNGHRGETGGIRWESALCGIFGFTLSAYSISRCRPVSGCLFFLGKVNFKTPLSYFALMAASSTPERSNFLQYAP